MWLLRHPQNLLITGFVALHTKPTPLTANTKTNKNRNEQILRTAEDALRTQETENSHKCQRKGELAKMKISYKFVILTIVEAENYYLACK